METNEIDNQYKFNVYPDDFKNVKYLKFIDSVVWTNDNRMYYLISGSIPIPKRIFDVDVEYWLIANYDYYNENIQLFTKEEWDAILESIRDKETTIETFP